MDDTVTLAPDSVQVITETEAGVSRRLVGMRLAPVEGRGARVEEGLVEVEDEQLVEAGHDLGSPTGGRGPPT